MVYLRNCITFKDSNQLDYPFFVGFYKQMFPNELSGIEKRLYVYNKYIYLWLFFSFDEAIVE